MANICDMSLQQYTYDFFNSIICRSTDYNILCQCQLLKWAKVKQQSHNTAVGNTDDFPTDLSRIWYIQLLIKFIQLEQFLACFHVSHFLDMLEFTKAFDMGLFKSSFNLGWKSHAVGICAILEVVQQRWCFYHKQDIFYIHAISIQRSSKCHTMYAADFAAVGPYQRHVPAPSSGQLYGIN